jgi:hypothetical protein
VCGRASPAVSFSCPGGGPRRACHGCVADEAGGWGGEDARRGGCWSVPRVLA